MPGLLQLPCIVGGMVAAILAYTMSGLAVQRWRSTILLGSSLLGALLTDVIVGPLIGAYSGDHFWALLPCLWLITFVTALVSAMLLALSQRADAADRSAAAHSPPSSRLTASPLYQVRA